MMILALTIIPAIAIVVSIWALYRLHSVGHHVGLIACGVCFFAYRLFLVPASPTTAWWHIVIWGGLALWWMLEMYLIVERAAAYRRGKR